MNPLNVRILPWRSGSRDHFFDAHVLDSVLEVLPVDRISIAQQEPGGVVIRKGVDNLLSSPFSRRIGCNVEVHDESPIMSQDKENKQNSKRCRRNREEINSYNVLQVVIEKSAPGLRRRLAMADHVFVNGRFGYFVAKPLKLRVNSRRPPSRVLTTQSPDENSNLGIDLRPPHRFRPRFPSPVESETLLVPSDDSLRLNDEENRAPIGPELGEPNPENPIAIPQLRSFGRMFENRELLA